ncbi:hypothetical protein B0H66DRAFT_605850 [Apodospora peruviana]|uniref:F-box domain-containing protein n=1 Tax=Apodospora peruviana TaxID=516989 RepID=A0AAE0M1T4_9PEZI|nr:hypothetical protein B0H66DRAFT_605850 [Apodospora peruviana]
MYSLSPQPKKLMDFPVEMLIEILSSMDVDTLFRMSHVNRRLKEIVTMHWPSIFMPIIKRDFSPVELLFRVFDVCSGKAVTALDHICDGDVFFGQQLVCSHRGCGKDVDSRWTTQLSSNDALTVFKVCLAVKKWEREFHRLRFARYPQYSRSLRPHELERLRLGLYVWWRFARYFHGGFQFDEGFEDQGRFWLRRPDSPDIRCNFMRQYSTTQLHEIMDVWNTIRSAVGREVCPSIVTIREQSDNMLSRAEASRIGWGDPIENDFILATIMKLRPEDILHLLVFRHRYTTKQSLIQFIRLKNPWIEQSIETFTEATETVLRERERMLIDEKGSDALDPGLYFPQSGFPFRHGGVVDHGDRNIERLRAKYAHDAGKGTHYSTVNEEYADGLYLRAAVPMGQLVATS